MRVFQIEGDWGMEHLKISTRAEPKAGPGQVVVQMRASSLNYRDLVVPNRGYGSHTGVLPLIPASDGVGIVTEVGEGVRRVAVGDRVCPTYFQRWIGGEPDLERLTQSLGGPIDGTMTEYMCLSEEGVSKVPAHLSDVEAPPCRARHSRPGARS
jgi:NADPH:quinone reductase-like Zn-dependent oxidoreductase